MALVNLGSIAVEARNKIGDTVYSRNRGGAYIRNKGVLDDPETSYQIAQRDRFTTVSQGWNALTNAQRNTWFQRAPLFPYTDIFGNSRIYSASVLYQKLNTNLLIAEQSMITTAPTPIGLPRFRTEPPVLNTEDYGWAFGIGPLFGFTGTSQVWWLSEPLTMGTYYFKNRLRIFDVTQQTVGPTLSDFYAAYVARWSDPGFNWRIACACHLINNTTGEASVRAMTYGDVVAP